MKSETQLQDKIVDKTFAIFNAHNPLIRTGANYIIQQYDRLTIVKDKVPLITTFDSTKIQFCAYDTLGILRLLNIQCNQPTNKITSALKRAGIPYIIYQCITYFILPKLIKNISENSVQKS